VWGRLDARPGHHLSNCGTIMSAFVISRCRQQGWLVGLVLLLGAAAPASAQLTSGLISQEQAARVGLKRAWFARAQIDPSRSRVVDWVLSGDQLLLVTDSGVIHALDANTGKSNWITEFGTPNYPSLGPDANDKFVAVINGSTVYLLDAKSGRIQGDRPLGGAPGAGPAVGNHHVFAPMINGLIEGYPLDLDAPQYKRWFYQSVGHILAPPLVTPESVVWTTDRGNMYVSGAERPGVRFRLETFSSFEARPAYRAPLIFAITVTGEMFAVDELSGQLVWRYTTGYATDRAPAAVGDKLFVTSDEPMLHCVDANTGAPLWRAPGVSQFAAASKQHVYGTDRYGTVYILNIADGSTVARVPTGGMFDALVNDQTDRLFLITEHGLVQCLHEIGTKDPIYYAKPAAVAAESEASEGEAPATDATEPATEPAAVPLDAVPVEVPAADATGENPFGDDAEAAPADEGGAAPTDDDNPFD
jgi:outer membrane protein assembly factor BamB